MSEPFVNRLRAQRAAGHTLDGPPSPSAPETPRQVFEALLAEVVSELETHRRSADDMRAGWLDRFDAAAAEAIASVYRALTADPFDAYGEAWDRVEGRLRESIGPPWKDGKSLIRP